MAIGAVTTAITATAVKREGHDEDEDGKRTRMRAKVRARVKEGDEEMGKNDKSITTKMALKMLTIPMTLMMKMAMMKMAMMMTAITAAPSMRILKGKLVGRTRSYRMKRWQSKCCKQTNCHTIAITTANPLHTKWQREECNQVKSGKMASLTMETSACIYLLELFGS